MFWCASAVKYCDDAYLFTQLKSRFDCGRFIVLNIACSRLLQIDCIYIHGSAFIFWPGEQANLLHIGQLDLARGDCIDDLGQTYRYQVPAGLQPESLLEAVIIHELMVADGMFKIMDPDGDRLGGVMRRVQFQIHTAISIPVRDYLGQVNTCAKAGFKYHFHLLTAGAGNSVHYHCLCITVPPATLERCAEVGEYWKLRSSDLLVGDSDD